MIKTLGESTKGSSTEIEAEPIGIGGKSEPIMKLLLAIIKSVSKSIGEAEEIVVPPRGRFKLGLISSLFDELWDDIQHISSTEMELLATCILTHLAGHISSLRLISADIEWLCTWVPELAQKLQRINADEEIEEEMEDGEEIEKSMFASYIRCWEQTRSRGYCCRFEDPTIMSSMLFTHCRPGHAPYFSCTTSTMQIFSIEVTMLEGFEWPLEIYGVVGASDAVDYRRNILFSRTRDDCQILTEHDSLLHLTGPSRAIVSSDTVKIEVQLKVKRTMRSKDRALFTSAFSCNGGQCDRFSTRSVDGYFCKIDLCCEYVKDSIQATILGVRVKKGSLPSNNGLQIACAALPGEDFEDKAERECKHIVLLAQKDGRIPMDEEGCIDLSRQVVSVKLEGRLEVIIKSFGESGEMSTSAIFKPQLSNITEVECALGDCELEVVVAWSLLVDDQQPMLMVSYAETVTNSPIPFMKLDEGGQSFKSSQITTATLFL